MPTKTLKEKEKEHLELILQRTSWDLEKTARILQIPLVRLKRKIREHLIERPKEDLPII